ncbi:hypothetical protein GGI35DRAFT_463761 [Trichoderma velutinum]
MLEENPDFDYMGVSAIPMPCYTQTSHALMLPEIKEHVDIVAAAAENAVFKAGFDGVEVHCPNVYLIDQSLQGTSNHRTDEYGGSLENKIRFARETIVPVGERIGQRRAE